ncbi:shikimate dehydrogenase family protein [Hymenobacter weizhouensis]|uniref:shikimate dehydrogenase family protein n=1 Tax=Hymenobacter sp. YIM 151500-1 TaxID=2987689 RepID=UPI002227A342|nr:shikimate dehydrogenase [Hymenobacter sp. YIM 151500-1]UYZ62822.1 shikimate dehydrogenase [Hymenobacter sp. YIM 151500-1]
MPDYGLIGRSLRHSFSQTYFTQKFHNLDLADHRYELFELSSVEELPALVQREPNLRGLNVTIPYKEKVWPFLDGVAPSAARVGAVNVIEFREDGRLIGHNTDMVGFRDSLRSFLPVGFQGRALVLGSGGASKAVEVALRDLNLGYWVVSRNPLGPGFTYDELTPRLLQEHPLIINTTPLGTFPDVHECPPLPYEALTTQHYLYDLIYNPRETEFMRRGATAGAQTKNGFEMLCLQAEAAWKIWQG